MCTAINLPVYHTGTLHRVPDPPCGHTTPGCPDRENRPVLGPWRARRERSGDHIGRHVGVPVSDTAWPERAGHTDANQVALAGRLALPGGKRACRCAGGVVEGQGHRRPNQTNPTQTRPGTRDCSTCGRVSGRAHTREQGNKGGELSFPLTATVGLWSLAALTD